MKESIQDEVGEWRREKYSRDIEIDISKKPKIEEEDWKIVRRTAVCNKRAYVEKWGWHFLSVSTCWRRWALCEC